MVSTDDQLSKQYINNKLECLVDRGARGSTLAIMYAHDARNCIYIDRAVLSHSCRTPFVPWKAQLEYQNNVMRRGICKGCQKRRQVSLGTYRCRECARVVEPCSTGQDIESLTSPTLEVPDVITSPSSQQTQMLSSILSAHTPAVQREGEADNISCFAQLPLMDLNSPLLGSAVDCLCLAHLDRSCSDVRLLEASRDRCGKTLISLAKVLQATHVSPEEHQETITSIMLISLYDEALPLNQRSKNSWITHYTGLQQYLEAAGPVTFSRGDRSDVILLENLSSPLYFLHLALRKQLVFGRPEWRQTLDITVALRTWFPQLVTLPGLVEKIDNSLKHSNADLQELCSELDGVRATKSRWFETGLEGDELETINVVDEDAFNYDIEEQALMANNATFKYFYRFSQPMMGSRAIMVWLSRLVAECTLLCIMNSNPLSFSVLKESGRTVKDVEEDAASIAADICRSVHYFSGLPSLAYAHVIHTLMETVQAFFMEAGLWKELEWCQGCLLATQTRLNRVGLTVSTGLCRVRDLGPYLATGMRYRSRMDFVDFPTHSQQPQDILKA